MNIGVIVLVVVGVIVVALTSYTMGRNDGIQMAFETASDILNAVLENIDEDSDSEENI